MTAFPPDDWLNREVGFDDAERVSRGRCLLIAAAALVIAGGFLWCLKAWAEMIVGAVG